MTDEGGDRVLGPCCVGLCVTTGVPEAWLINTLRGGGSVLYLVATPSKRYRPGLGHEPAEERRRATPSPHGHMPYPVVHSSCRLK